MGGGQLESYAPLTTEHFSPTFPPNTLVCLFFTVVISYSKSVSEDLIHWFTLILNAYCNSLKGKLMQISIVCLNLKFKFLWFPITKKTAEEVMTSRWGLLKYCDKLYSIAKPMSTEIDWIVHAWKNSNHETLNMQRLAIVYALHVIPCFALYFY